MCAGQIVTLNDMKKAAQKRGGKCLSKEYTSGSQKLEWECDKGHRWKAIARNVKNNRTWCPKCAGKNVTTEDMHNLAKKRGGKFLSPEYTNGTTKHLWACSKGHQWEMTPKSVKKGRWCRKCS